MVKGGANVWVPMEDIERALDFYQNTLNFPVIKQDGPWAEIDANGLNIGLNGREPKGAQGGGPVITFEPEAGIEAAVEGLKGKGVEFPRRRSPSMSGGELLRSRTARATTSSSTNPRAVEVPRGTRS